MKYLKPKNINSETPTGLAPWEFHSDGQEELDICCIDLKCGKMANALK